jgi:hypothetical protein
MTGTDPAPSPVRGPVALARRAAGATLDRVGARAAVLLGDDVTALRLELEAVRAELERTRAELTAEIELIRAELAGRDA